MTTGVNFADPAFEASDEDLATLSREAFADAEAANRHALERLREQIREQRRLILEAVAQDTQAKTARDRSC